MEMWADRSEACAALAAVYRSRLEDLEAAIRGLVPDGEDLGLGQVAKAPGRRRMRTRPRRRKSSGVLRASG